LRNNEERILFVDLWRSLKGDDNDGVLIQNLKIFLGAIQGFHLKQSKENDNTLQVYDSETKNSPMRSSPISSSNKVRDY
jgi:hypothetical protein